MTRRAARVDVALPWPDKRLSPNSRTNRWELAEAKREAKKTSTDLVKERYYDPPDFGNSFLLLVRYFHPPDRRMRDEDNIVASLKAYQDGACSAFGIDDSRIQATVNVFCEPVPGGRISLTLRSLAGLYEFLNDGLEE